MRMGLLALVIHIGTSTLTCAHIHDSHSAANHNILPRLVQKEGVEASKKSTNSITSRRFSSRSKIFE